jgi:hypothetical protein
MTVGTLQSTSGISLTGYTMRLIEDVEKVRYSIQPPTAAAQKAAAASTSEPHVSKVCSALLPIYPACDAQKDDVYKGYDKITTSPTHQLTLPAWNVSAEKCAKYRNPNY